MMGGLDPNHRPGCSPDQDVIDLFIEDYPYNRQCQGLAYMIERCCESRCEDLRDKVYGIQACIPESLRVAIDYKKPVEEVYVDCVMAILREGEGASSVMGTILNTIYT